MTPAQIESVKAHAQMLIDKDTEIARLRSGLEAVIAQCPRTKPEPARDGMGYYRSEGNSDDVATDVMNDALWAIAEIAGAALWDTRPEG